MPEDTQDSTKALAPPVQQPEVTEQSDSDEPTKSSNRTKPPGMRELPERDYDKGERVRWTSTSGRTLYGKVHDHRLRNNAWQYQLREDSGALYEKWVEEGKLAQG